MKLALVVPGGVDRSGEQRVIPALLALLMRLAARHEVHVFALRQEARPGRWKLAGAEIHNVGDGWQRLRAIAAIRAEHRRSPFDLVQAIFSGSCGLVAVGSATMLHLPSLVHVAGGELVAMHDIGYGGRRRWCGRVREALVLRGANVVTAASAPAIEALRALGIEARRVPLGAGLDAWPPMAPRVRHARPARLIHVASLNRVKDQPTLLRALAALAERGTEFTMDVVGVDTLGGEIERLAGHLGLARRLRFHGFKTQRELRVMMAAADVLVLSSRHETGPLVLLEAALSGVPTVGTRVGHLAEWAPTAAVAVPVGDAAALAGAIARLLEDEGLRLQLACAAQQLAMRDNADRTARHFQLLYRRVCRRGR
ncbi:MAG TPA: glycosyltransferase family 4 protein [Rhodanobacteraceae bacterium]|nr:glycosyltransferase family 4 protein [Rhodanobacteraceae bacterium]